MTKKILQVLLLIVMLSIPFLNADSVSRAGASTKIKIAMEGGITSLDPVNMNSSQNISNNVFECLIGYDTNNKMIPVLAESWAFSPDFLTLTVKLKKDVKFSTGDSFTAADVKFTLDRDMSIPGMIAAQLTQNYSGMTIVDDYTVKFHFPAVNVQFLPQTLSMAFMFSKTQYEKLGEDAWVKNPAGTGPYKYVDFKEGQYCDITYNDHYRGNKPEITDARFYFTADSATRIAQLEAGEADIVKDVPGVSIARLTNKGFAEYRIQRPHVIALQFGYLNQSAPWAKLEVRQAIAHAIDNDMLNEKVFGGVYKKGVYQLPWELGYDPSLQPDYMYDIGKARSLMTAAGYPNGFEMTIYYPTFISWATDMIDYISSALAQIGIMVKPFACSDFGSMAGTWMSLHNDPKKMGVLLWEQPWPGNPDPSINLTNGFYFKKDNTIFNDPELNDLISQILKTPDDSARAGIVHQAYERIDSTLPILPIFLEVTLYASDSNIQYSPSVGGLNTGPMNIFELSVR